MLILQTIMLFILLVSFMFYLLNLEKPSKMFIVLLYSLLIMQTLIVLGNIK